MFKKVLVSDDLVSINLGIYTVLEQLKIPTVDTVQYCDDAFLKLKKAHLDGVPFDLLISDLSFKKDHREQNFSSGTELIAECKKLYPDLKIIVYTVEDRVQKVRNLMKNIGCDGYVCKGRRGLIELSKAIEVVYNGNTYIFSMLEHALRDNQDLEIEDYDIKLIELLSQGLSQEQISNHFQKNKISPSSLSSIEKRINRLRIQFKANNVVHLVSISKDLGFI